MKKPIVVHPFLFAVLPVIFLYAYNAKIYPSNIHQLEMDFFILLSSASGLFISLAFILKSAQKSGMIVSVFSILVFLYGPLDVLIQKHLEGDISLMVLIILLTLFIEAILIILKSKKRLPKATKAFNMTALMAFGINISFLLSTNIYYTRNQETQPAVKTVSGSSYPDIYYIVLDDYAGNDILKRDVNYDNAPFLDFLTKKGFFVPSLPRSNYGATLLSLASSLNSIYLDNLAQEMGSNNLNLMPLVSLVLNSRTAHFLKGRGYTVVAFASGFYGTEMIDADAFLSPPKAFSEFQTKLIEMTPLPLFLKKFSRENLFESHRNNILWTLYKIPRLKIRTNGAPVFVFSHIVAPHPPFVFGKNGEKTNPSYPFCFYDGIHLRRETGMTLQEYTDRYRNQLIFITDRLRDTIERLLSSSREPPVIILQSDHGSRLRADDEEPYKERFSILSAYYFPDSDYRMLYRTISPVNSFRVVFNKFFSAGLPLLEDKSFFSTGTHPYQFYEYNHAANTLRLRPEEPPLISRKR